MTKTLVIPSPALILPLYRITGFPHCTQSFFSVQPTVIKLKAVTSTTASQLCEALLPLGLLKQWHSMLASAGPEMESLPEPSVIKVGA